MTFATVRAATQHAIRQGHLTPHQLAALGRLDESLTAEQRQEFTDGWRAQGSPAAPVPEPAWLPSARKIIKEFEGLRLQAYPDAGAWAVGWGSTTISGKVVREGQSITQAQADAQLDADLKRFHEALVRAIPAVSSWQPNRIAALLSWTYNLGVGAMQDSTLRKRILAGEDPAVVVAAELPRWNKSGGTPLAGLTRRRKAEVELFVGRQLQQPVTSAPTATERSQWVTQIKALNLSQPDSVTCQAACIGMAVGDRDIMKIRGELIGRGDAGSPAVMAAVIRNYGRPYIYDGNASMAKIYQWLKAGEFLITHGWFTGSGHVICLDGLKRQGNGYSIDVKDPWSQFNESAWAYNLGSKFFDGFYSDRCIYAACCAGASVADAKRVYQTGKVDTARGGMWVHRFTTS
jgi:GH24 family phage-related lysozyme (muramidase)